MSTTSERVLAGMSQSLVEDAMWLAREVQALEGLRSPSSPATLADLAALQAKIAEASWLVMARLDSNHQVSLGFELLATELDVGK